MLNAMSQREFGEKLQIYPRVTQLLKSYNTDYVRKVASFFDKKDIESFLTFDENSPYFLVRKAAVVIALSGGLRTAELRDLSFENVVQKDIYIRNYPY